MTGETGSVQAVRRRMCNLTRSRSVRRFAKQVEELVEKRLRAITKEAVDAV